jgi:hypothetical protein
METVEKDLWIWAEPVQILLHSGDGGLIIGFQTDLFPIWDAATAKVPPHIGVRWHVSQKSVVWVVYGR